MASAVPPPPSSGGVSASIWASQPSPARTGPSKESEPTSRGAPRGGPRGRGGRGGRGSRGGRPGNGRGVAPADNNPAKKVGPEASKDTVSSGALKPDSPPALSEPSLSTQSNATSKGPARSRHGRKSSEARPPRKAFISAEGLATAPSVSTSTSSPALSSRNTHRRKRSQTQNQLPPSASTGHARRQSIISVISETGSSRVDKPFGATAAAKDVPPHMAPLPVLVHQSELVHNIEAFVERVRAVAMDRPHTPGSHFDWAGDEDDSLPDLDDWGVTSSLSTTGPITEVAESEPAGVSVMSPILQDTLKPLPSVADTDIPTPSIKLHEVNGVEHADDIGVPAIVEDATPHSAPGVATPSVGTGAMSASAETVSAPTVENKAEDRQSLHSASAGLAESSLPNKPAFRAGRPQSVDLSFQASSPPERGLSASMHAISSSQSPPNNLHARSFTHAPRDGFQPSHNRAHTVGRFKNDSHSDSDRPRKSDYSHGRNHSTPPAGPGAHGLHPRAPHATRPVISGDAISRLARTLGGSSISKREREATPSAN